MVGAVLDVIPITDTLRTATIFPPQGALFLVPLGQQQVPVAGAGQGGLRLALLTGSQLQPAHVTNYCCGIKCLLPLAFGKVLLNLGTDRFMDILIQRCVSSDPWVLKSLFTRVTLAGIFFH